MSRIMKTRWRKAKTNGNTSLAAPVPKKPTPRALAKEELLALAKRGAAVRLRELEREAEKLRLFLAV